MTRWIPLFWFKCKTIRVESSNKLCLGVMNGCLDSLKEYNIPSFLCNYGLAIKIKCKIIKIFIKNILTTCVCERIIVIKWGYKLTLTGSCIPLSLNHKVELPHWIVKIQFESSILYTLCNI